MIDTHYKVQMNVLTFSNDTELNDLVTKCHKEECEHHDVANAESGVDLAATYPILTSVIKRITKTAIEIAKKI